MQKEKYLQICKVFKKYGSKYVVNDIDLEVRSGEVVGLLGPNGAGKTTTFSMVSGFTKPTQGEILLNQNNITHLPPHKRAQVGLVYLPQESSVFRKLTVEDNIRAIAQSLKLGKSQEDELVDHRLEELKLTSLAKQKAYTLSGGERRRLEITRALVLNPDFLLLDEPFGGVDPISASEVMKIILSLKEKGIGVFITDHNVRETLRIVDRAYLLYDGKVLAHGDSEHLLNDEATRSKYLGQDFVA